MHEDDCQHRLVKCFLCYDGFNDVPLSGLTEHLCQEHKQEAFPYDRKLGQYGRRIATINDNFCKPIIKEDGEQRITFFINMVMQEGRYLFWITHNLSKHEDQAYEYTISLFSNKKTRGKFARIAKHSGFCTPLDANSKACLPCLVIPEDFIKKSVFTIFDSGKVEHKVTYEICIDKANNMLL